MAWRLSPALSRLRTEINDAYPGRAKASDGSIGDATHSARTSDHNPDGHGWVRAIDVTEWDPGTPGNPADDVAEALAEYLRRVKPARVKYVIWRRRMFSSYSTASRRAWEWGPYHGTANPHEKHCHVSVVADSRGLDPAPWGFTRPGTTRPAPAPVPQEDDMTPEQAALLVSAEKHAAAADLRAQALEQRLTAVEAALGTRDVKGPYPGRLIASNTRIEAHLGTTGR